MSEQSNFGRPKRPTAVTVFGMLNLMIGVSGVCCYGLASVLMFIALNPQRWRDNSVLPLMEEYTLYRTINQAGMLLGLVSSVVLIAAGIGLLRLRPYGRTLSIGYGIYAIVINVLLTIFGFMFVFPALFEKANASGGWSSGAGDGLIGNIIGIGMRLTFAGILLYFMFRPYIAEAFKFEFTEDA